MLLCMAGLVMMAAVALGAAVSAILGPGKAARLGHAVIAEIMPGEPLRPPSLFDDNLRSDEERGWSCMAHFQAQQQRHENARVSWATPPADTRNWVSRMLWPAVDTRPMVQAETMRPGPRVIIAGVVKNPDPAHVAAHIPVRVVPCH